MKTLKVSYESKNIETIAAVRASGKLSGNVSVYRADKNLLFLDRIQMIKGGKAFAVKRGTSVPSIEISMTSERRVRRNTYSGLIVTLKNIADADKVTESDVLAKLTVESIDGVVTAVKGSKHACELAKEAGLIIGKTLAFKVL